MTSKSKYAQREDLDSINEKLDKLTSMLDDNIKNTDHSIQELMSEVKEMRKSQQFIEQQYEDMKAKLAANGKELTQLRAENKDLKAAVQQLQAACTQSKEDINDLEQYGRRECLEFKGLVYKENENTDDLVIAVTKKMNLNIKKEDISVSHRLRKATSEEPKPTIIARFCSRKTRDLIYYNRHKLKTYNMSSPSESLFVNESLTRTNRSRFNQCLKFKKDNNFKYIWTKNGAILLRKNDGASVITIKSDKDLVRHKITC